ncbi:MAG: hypothetical protein AAF433_14575 [Bacteroidota bacterium]
MKISYTFFLITGFLLLACQQQQPQPLDIHFYHWQQRLEPDSLNHHLLEMSAEPVLFTKVCDLAWVAGEVEPRAVLEVAAGELDYELQPVVFITNKVMLELGQLEDTKTELQQLANNLLGLIERRLEGQPPYRELQIDCDWTRGSATTYFQFLEELQDRLPAEITLSATVRLHQWRDVDLQGVPPVKRGVLMAYNSGDLQQWETENSILDTSISAAYLQAVDYPLLLDVALPLYQWGAIYRQGELAYLINDLDLEILKNSSRFERLAPGRFIVRKATYLQGIYCYTGDLIRWESSNAERLAVTAQQLRQVVPAFTGQRLLFFRQGGQLAHQTDSSWLRSLAE